jgi:hypothetical protein
VVGSTRCGRVTIWHTLQRKSDLDSKLQLVETKQRVTLQQHPQQQRRNSDRQLQHSVPNSELQFMEAEKRVTQHQHQHQQQHQREPPAGN